MTISNTQLIWQLIIAFAIGGTLAYLFWKQRQEAKKSGPSPKPVMSTSPSTDNPTRQLQLQAYERMILLADRIALPNIISRNAQGLTGMPLRDTQLTLTQQIKQEFEYNVTQQIYVSADAWEAVRNLKDQNIMIVNQVASFLPQDASGHDLSRAILEMLAENPKATLHNVVSDVLSYEAKKLM
ncbi:MAG: hypothetical protein EOO00_01025 [Chitinophagaceae bacterium]|nr:MAG: hypothetical protein EOO00_01025 [Chitinophagaceae bacterium]